MCIVKQLKLNTAALGINHKILNFLQFFWGWGLQLIVCKLLALFFLNYTKFVTKIFQQNYLTLVFTL